MAFVPLAGPAAAASCSTSWTNAAGGSWTTAGNWSSGVPTSTSDACITLAGTYSVSLPGPGATVNSLSVGGATGTQTLSVGSTCSAHAVLTTTTGLTVNTNGVVVLTNADACGDNVTVTGPIANGGVFQADAPVGGSRTVQGNLTNTGSLVVNTNLTYNGAATTLSNTGSVTVANATALSVVSTAGFTNGSGGTITAVGTGAVSETGGTFTETGATTGTQPVIVDDATLTYSGSSGASTVALRGSSSLSGDLAANQTLNIQSTCGEHATIAASASLTNAGAITLTNGDGCGYNATLQVSSGATLTNSGTLTTSVGIGGTRTLQGNITNTGTVAVNTTTGYNSAGTFDNQGTVNIATGVSLAGSSGANITATSGSINATGSGALTLLAGTFTQGAGTTTGTKPVILDDLTLSYTGGGASLIALHGSSTLTGNLASGQVLNIESTCGEHAVLTTSASFTNAGTITLTNGDGCGYNATLQVSSGATLTNSGTLTTSVGIGGTRTLQGNITNTGTVAVNTTTGYNSAGTFNNQGTVNIATGVSLAGSGGANITATSGSINATGSGALTLLAGTFTQGAGTTTGTKPVILDDLTLSYTGGGASLIAVHGSSTLTGNLASGQVLNIESTCGQHAVLTTSASFTNAGAITLTNGDGCGNNATFQMTSGATLTNSGTLTTSVAIGGTRTLQGNITNTGTVAVNTTTGYNSAGTFNNQGTVNIATGVSLAGSGGANVTATSGSINAPGSGALTLLGGTFTQGAGTTTGTKPVILDDLTLSYTGTGKGSIAIRGSSTLTGNLASGQVLNIESTCGEHATVSEPVSFTNTGTISLTNGDVCGNNVTLTVNGGSGTLTNNGTLNANFPVGGSRTLTGNLTNTKTLVVQAGATFHVSGAYTQSSKGSYAPGIASATKFGSLTISGSATLAGKLTLSKPFKGTAGQTFNVLSAASRTGTFSSVKGGVINKTTALYYDPTYTPTGVNLVITQASESLGASTVAPGASLSVSGSSFPANDSITITLTDSASVKTTYPAVPTDGSGNFSTSITVPAGAAAGTATVTSTNTLTGVAVTKPVTVT